MFGSTNLYSYFDQIGFDLSILVHDGSFLFFLTIFAFPFCSDFGIICFVLAFRGSFRLSVAILVLYQNDILNCDIIQVSDFIHVVGTTKLRREKDIQSLFDVMLTLTGVQVHSQMNV